jgi:hypothetical protein
MPAVRLLTIWTSSINRGTEFGTITPEGDWKNLGDIAVNMETSGALAEFAGKLFFAYQGNGGSLRIASYANESWSEPVTVGERVMSESPSLVAHNGKLWAFYQGPGFDGKIRYAQTDDGRQWTLGEQPLPKTKTSASPAAVQFQGRLYVFHQSSKNTGYLYFTMLNADGNWTTDTRIEGVRMSDSPTPVVFKGSLYVFHQGISGNEELWYTASADGGSWRDDAQISDMRVTYSPAASVLGQTLYVATNKSDRALTLARSADGVSWKTAGVEDAWLSRAPSLIAYPSLNPS